eukprot:scaffold2724_cov193-Amphora_coffeaeformis.AAC.1
MTMMTTMLRKSSSSSCRRVGLSMLMRGQQTQAPVASCYLYSTTATTLHPPLKDSYDNVLVEKLKEARVGIVTLHRPQALNALSKELFADLLHATAALDADPDVGCLIVTGSSKAFAAGADIAQMQDQTFVQAYTADMFAEWASFTSTARKPVLAAVRGYALGGGCELAMMCDFIIASETAQFGQPEVNLGVMPGAGGTQRLTRAIGKSKAMYLCLTGELIGASDMYHAGLLAKVVPDDQLMDTAVATATKIASKGQVAIQMTKEAVNASQELSLQEGLRLERRLFHSLFATHDQKEGMKAFLEKRKPNFKHE